MADILTDEQVVEIEKWPDQRLLLPAPIGEIIPNLIATLRHVQAENERLEQDMTFYHDAHEQLKRENARLREALVNVRKTLGDFQDPWSSREYAVDEIARQALATEGEMEK